MPSLRSFISRLAEPQLLRLLLQRHGIEIDPELYAGTPTQLAAAIEGEALGTGRGKLALLTSDIERVEKLADEPGEVAIESVTVHDDLAELPSRHARALYVFLQDFEGFRRAEEIVYSDARRRGRDWSPFGGKAGLDPASDPTALEAFKEALRVHFDTRHVHIDIFTRSRIGFPDDESDGRTLLTQITIYREDRPNAEWAFQQDGGLGTQVRRRVVEAAITYESSTGTIECVASQRDSRAEMVRLMALNLLKSEPDFEPVPLPIYNLDPLRSRVNFERDPEDQIEEVRVAMLRLSPIDASAERITVESLSRNDRDIWETVETRLGAEALASHYQIDQARLVIRYRSADSNRTRLLPITITQPHRSNIKDRAGIEQLVANKYLPRWGLVAA